MGKLLYFLVDERSNILSTFYIRGGGGGGSRIGHWQINPFDEALSSPSDWQAVKDTGSHKQVLRVAQV